MQKNNHQPGLPKKNQQSEKLRDELGVGNSTVMIPYRPNPIIIEAGIAEAISQTIFKPEACAEIIKKHSPADWPEGTLRNTNEIDPDLRQTKSTFLKVQDDPELFDMMLAIALKGNEHFQFDLDFFDAIQLSKYEVGDFYSWHVDIGPQHAGNRKLSITVQLSAPDSYEGGDLEMGGVPLKEGGFWAAPRDLGSVTLFPSFMRHRVTPVTKGTRYSLVAWCSGERRFR